MIGVMAGQILMVDLRSGKDLLISVLIRKVIKAFEHPHKGAFAEPPGTQQNG